MLNIKTLTDTLSDMDLQELHDYARVNKNDPYIVSMALSMANTKKKIDIAQKGRAGMQPQPKVVDQQIAQMVAPPPQQMAQAMPEDQGIGQLPAPNMQNMAEGGIVAFDDGGEVPGYLEGGVPSGAIIIGNMYKDPVTGEMKPIPEQSAVPFGDPAVMNARPYGQAKVDELLNKRKAAAQSIVKESPEDYASRKVAEFEAQAGKKLSPDARLAYMSQFVQDKIAGQVKRGEAGYTTDSQLPAPTTTYTGAKPLPGKTPPGQPPVAPGAAAPSSEDAYTTGINKLLGSVQTASNMGPMTKLDAKRYSFTPEQLSNLTPADYAAAITSAMPKDPTASPLDARQLTLNTANVAARQKYANDLEKQFKEQGLAFTDTLNKLTSKEKRVQTMEDNQLGMSMFEAGLAMMAGESPYAMVNIGKGAQVGTKKYMEIQDKVEGARDKIDDAKMKIEEFRRNEANMNAREQRLARKDVDDAVSTGAQAMLNLAQQEYGLNRQQAISFVTNSQLAQQFNVGEKNRANAQNQQTAANIDTAYANMANQRSINADNKNMQLELARLEAKYRASNPAAGSLGFFKALAPDGDPVKGMKVYSESLGPEAKGIEADILAWSKTSEPEKMAARKFDPMGSAQKDRLLRERLLQGSVSDKPAGAVLDQPR